MAEPQALNCLVQMAEFGVTAGWLETSIHLKYYWQC